MQSSSQIIIIKKPTSSFFNRPDALPVANQQIVKALKGKYHIPWICLPQAHLGSSNFVSDQLCLIPPGYLVGELPCHLGGELPCPMWEACHR